MDLSWFEGIPIGFVLFGGTLLAVLRRRAGRRSARKGYPRLGERFGLTFEPPSHPKELGSLRGEFQGYDVMVRADQARIVVELPTRSWVDLRNYTHWKRQPPDLEGFSFGTRWADLWMVGRYCHPNLTELIHADPEWVQILGKLKGFERQLKQLTVEGERLEAVFDFGSPAHIPSGAVAHLLPELVALADKCVQASQRAF